MSERTVRFEAVRSERGAGEAPAMEIGAADPAAMARCQMPVGHPQALRSVSYSYSLSLS